MGIREAFLSHQPLSEFGEGFCRLTHYANVRRPYPPSYDLRKGFSANCPGAATRVYGVYVVYGAVVGQHLLALGGSTKEHFDGLPQKFRIRSSPVPRNAIPIKGSAGAGLLA